MLLIFLPFNSARSDYIFDVIFNGYLGINYLVTNDVTTFKNYGEEKINYSDNKFTDEIFIKNAAFLQGAGVKEIDIKIEEKNHLKVLFPNNDLCDSGFDIFSAAFFMLSRYEEYLPFSPDLYGRFKAEDSIAYKHNFLQIPIVDKWIELLKITLHQKFPFLKFKAEQFTAIVTCDIDVAYKFKGRNFKRTFGSSFKDLLRLDLKNIRSRFKTLRNKTKDPWDVYDDLLQSIDANNLDSIFFFLLADNTLHDRNLTYNNASMAALINKIKTVSKIGIHPSFKSSLFIEKISLEKNRLEKISGEAITKSRQHFLKFILPETYNALSSAGIMEDYSMGFAGLPGFRAGTSKPFCFYDLKNEKVIPLKIFPVTMMDGNFMNKNYSDVKQVPQHIFKLIEEVKNVNGTFISIWHNHTVSDTKEYSSWKAIHEQMIAKLHNNITG